MSLIAFEPAKSPLNAFFTNSLFKSGIRFDVTEVIPAPPFASIG